MSKQKNEEYSSSLGPQSIKYLLFGPFQKKLATSESHLFYLTNAFPTWAGCECRKKRQTRQPRNVHFCPRC